MTDQRDKRVAIRTLLAAGMNVSQVACQMACSRNTVAHVRDFGVKRKEQERTRTARTPDLVPQVEETVCTNPNTSVRALVRDTGTSRSTMYRLVVGTWECTPM